MRADTQIKLARVKTALGLALLINAVFWCGSSGVYARWSGVPPAPSRAGAVGMTLGDPQFSYRFLALTLQSLGDGGADVTPLKDYDYPTLGRWFALLSGLDPVSDHVPMLAGWYFGATKVPKDAAVIANYLAVIGQDTAGEKWRWLAHAVFLAQHRAHDFDLALKLAHLLANMPNSAALPQWARQMPAFVLANKGDREAAREMMVNMLLTEKNMRREEVNTIRDALLRLGAAREDIDRIIRTREEGR
jgi:hypothetical protein